jgi:hypothetical protein
MQEKIVFLYMGMLSLFFCYFSPTSFAYESIPFKNGGSIEGVVEFAGGTIPTDPMLTLSSETEYCGTSIPAQKYLIKNGKIQNVVVYIKEIKAGKPIPSEPAAVTNQKCAFMPHVAVGFKGKKIKLKTDDPVFHTFDLHASLSGKELFHLGLHEKGSAVTKTLSKSGLLELSCYVHPWQHAYLYVFDHPYAVVTDASGKFVIKDIPPGTYTIEAWHEALGTEKIADINVESGKTTTIRLKYTKEQ